MKPETVDFFFSPYPSAQKRRLRAALQDGIAHGSRISPYDPTPDKAVTLLFSTSAQTPIDQIAIYYTTNGREPSGQKGTSHDSIVILAYPEETIDDQYLEMSIRNWRATIPAQPDGTLVRYCADGWNRRNSKLHWYADHADPVSMPPEKGRIFAYHVDRWAAPDWLDDAVLYQIFVDRFNAGSDEPPMLQSGNIVDYFGGTLRGVIEKLDYIQALGTNCIWLSPIFESPIYHGYNPSDYFHVDKHYGTDETLHELVTAVHSRGMRIILDFVANHTSNEHPAFLQAAKDPDGPTGHWYAFGDWPPHGYRSYALVGNMPELMTDQPDVQRYLADAARHWLGDYKVDGLRLDYVPGPVHAFWTLFEMEIKEHFPQAATIGEITTPIEEIVDYAGRMDAFMDFPLAQVLRNVFALRTQPLTALLNFLDERIPSLPPTMKRATLLDNHDMHRFLWIADGNIAQLKLATTCHLTLDGTPIIYYGTEVGLSQYSDAHKENAYARPAMIWDERQDHSLLEHYRRLTSLRQSYPALRLGKRQNLPVEIIEETDSDTEQVGAYIRWLDREQPLLVVLNNAKTAAKIRVKLTEQDSFPSTTLKLENLLPTGESQEMSYSNNIVELRLGGLEAAILASAS